MVPLFQCLRRLLPLVIAHWLIGWHVDAGALLDCGVDPQNESSLARGDAAAREAQAERNGIVSSVSYWRAASGMLPSSW